MTSLTGSDVTTDVDLSRHRVLELLRQLPPHDNEARYCNGLNDGDKSKLDEFREYRLEKCIGRGVVTYTDRTAATCQQCDDVIGCNVPIVIAERATDPEVCWHTDCFVCCVCEQLLVDLVYFWADGRVFCGRHHAELLRPRCTACDELIFSDDCTEAEGRFWHLNHFTCTSCRCTLGGQRYVIHDVTGSPFCCDCYHTQLADHCVACLRIIAVGERHVIYDERKWHAECFRCQGCRKSLVGAACYIANGRTTVVSGTANQLLLCTDKNCHERTLRTGGGHVARSLNNSYKDLVALVMDTDLSDETDKCRTPEQLNYQLSTTHILGLETGL